MTDSKNPPSGEEIQVVDFNEKRIKKMDEKRRKTERIFFKQILGIYSVSEQSKMRPIEIIDVSEAGLAFQVPFDSENPWPTQTQDVHIRLYFSQDTYLPLSLNIQNSRPYIEEGIRYVRYGCTVDTSFSGYEAYAHFVKFLKLFSEHAYKDKGAQSLFYL